MGCRAIVMGMWEQGLEQGLDGVKGHERRVLAKIAKVRKYFRRNFENLGL